MTDTKISKTALCRAVGFASNAMAKMVKGLPVSIEVVANIYRVHDCTTDALLMYCQMKKAKANLRSSDMKHIDYKQSVSLTDQKQVDQAVLICYYHFKETRESQFEPKGIQALFSDFGFNAINVSRVKKALLEKRKMRTIRGMQSTLEFIPTVLQELESQYSSLWNDTENIESSSELIDESKFCGKRGYLDKLIKQINHTFSHNCFDACAVLLRRLFEILLVLTYQNTGNEAAISKSDGTHFMLEAIVKDAVQNKGLGIPARISKNFDAFREVGNNSAHSITYTAGQKDITDIKRDYRVMMEDLYNRAGLM